MSESLRIFGVDYANVAGIKAQTPGGQTIIHTAGGGGGSVAAKEVNFYDYDGTIVNSYTAQEFAALSALPANPSHTGLTARGWNWTLAKAKAYAAKYGRLDIGQMYRTTSGDTEMDCVFDDQNFLSPWLAIAVNGTVEVDWGDGSAKDTVTGTSNTTLKYQQHVYAQTGSYTIMIHVSSGQFTFYSSSSSYVSPLRTINAASNRARSRAYSGTIQRIRIGSGARIGSNAFQACSSLQSIVIPDSVTSIVDNAFYYCSSLQSIVIPDSVTSIGSYAFRYNYSLQSVVIPDSVTSIGSYAFSNCSSLQSVVIPDSVTSIVDSEFYNCSSLRSVVIPDSVTSIGSTAFYNCSSLQSVVIPDSVESIGSSAFYSCLSLQSIVIPDSVTSIGSSAFYYCYDMYEYFLPETPPTLDNTNAFNGIMAGTVMYVPYSADHSILAAYQSATNWSQYSSYMQEEAA